jgi:hypothetical protein
MTDYVGNGREEAAERNFLDHYFASIYNKLEADALLFNRKLPHAGLAGAENEIALAALIRDFLPPRFGVEVSGIIIDRFGGQSRQADIIIYDAAQVPRYLRKVFPVELVFAVIEVKTTLTSAEALKARDNLKSVFDLEFRPALTPYWEHQAQTLKVAQPPLGIVFAFRSATTEFATFQNWFPIATVMEGVPLTVRDGRYEIRGVLVGCLDKGVIKMSSTNLNIQGIAAIADGPLERAMPGTVMNRDVNIDPAKSLFLLLETLWQFVADSEVHPGFDIRSYLSHSMSRIMTVNRVHEAPLDWYAAPQTEQAEIPADPGAV